MERLSRKAANALVSAMPREMRKEFAHGRPIGISIHRLKPMERWGNTAHLILRRDQILANDLVKRAWSRDRDKAREEAARAVDYFVFGASREYETEFKWVEV